MSRWSRCVVLAAAIVAGAAASSERITLVVCAPGYAGNTEQAQPVMDDLARAVTLTAGWSGAALEAVYHERLEGGLEQLAEQDAALALVPLPLYLEYRERLSLEPVLEVVQASGPSEQWSLVASRGAIKTPEDLAGWQLFGMPGYAPRFIRRVALAGWGELPDGLEIRFTSRVLSVLRKAAEGERVAVLLDTAQTNALGSLPFADELEIVATSEPLIGSLLCRVGDRLESDEAAPLLEALVRLHEEQGTEELLETLRVARFQRLPAAGTGELERAFAEK